MSDSLAQRLRELAASDFYPFHMPGHKRISPDGRWESWYSCDITEISGFDHLHHPEDILLAIGKKAAALYQADESFLLINGSTAGILGAVATVAAGLDKGKKLLIARHSHLSVYHAAYLNDIPLAYIYPCDNAPRPITTAEVAAILETDPAIGAILLTSPTYEGICHDVAGIAALAHRRGMCLIVDQAHGAHFGFHPDLPENATREGADIVIHSLHKTLPSLTQTALLHTCGDRIDRRTLHRHLRIFQSSSPSYPLMASIERCLDFLDKEGMDKIGQLMEMRQSFIDRFGQSAFFRTTPSSLRGATSPQGRYDEAVQTDPCKLVIYIHPGCHLTGK
jgi:arginine/lysine/ornithine decarboxylase